MSTLLQDFKAQWQQLNIDAGHKGVLVAASGGADSMVLAELCRQAGALFGVAHINFGMRGADSDADEQLVQQWAFSHNVLSFSTRFDTKTKAVEWGKGIQETARILRYTWLEEIRERNHFSAILTAHHANDEAESILLRIISGAGLSGIQGIPAQNGFIARPLLPFAKKRLLSFAADQQVPFREDASNSSDAYLRNKVRNHIMPVTEQHFPEAVQQLRQAALRLQDAQVYYQQAMARERKKLLHPRGPDFYIPIRALRLRPALPTLCYELLRAYGYTWHQMPDVLRLLDAQSGRLVASPTHRVIRNREFLIVTAAAQEAADFIPVAEMPCSIATRRGVISFSAGAAPAVFPDDPRIAFLNKTELEAPLLLRPARTGDYFYPFGMKLKKKKISRFLTDLKVPLHEKQNVWVLESNRRIAWVVGYRMDERFRVQGGEVVRVEVKG